jgi:hypothetical protein
MGILKIKFDVLQIRFLTNTTIKEFLFKELEKVCAKNNDYNLCRYMLDGFVLDPSGTHEYSVSSMSLFLSFIENLHGWTVNSEWFLFGNFKSSIKSLIKSNGVKYERKISLSIDEINEMFFANDFAICNLTRTQAEKILHAIKYKCTNSHDVSRHNFSPNYVATDPLKDFCFIGTGDEQISLNAGLAKQSIFLNKNGYHLGADACIRIMSADINIEKGD